jgi:hypothetical protein
MINKRAGVGYGSIEELVEEILGSSKSVEMFQAMATVSLKMGNLGLEVKSFKTRLIIMEEKK